MLPGRTALRRNLAVSLRRPVNKIEAEKTNSFLGAGPVTAAGFEEDVRTGSEAEIAFNQFAADNVRLFSGVIDSSISTVYSDA